MARKIRKLWVTFATTCAIILAFCVGANAETASTVVLVDESYSSNYFSYKAYAEEYLKDAWVDVVRFGNNGKTTLYDQVQQAIDEGYTNIYIISDCWNTSGSKTVQQNNAKIILLTPYFRSDEVYKHLSNVAKELNSSEPMEVYYWNEWPKMEKAPRLEPETDPDEDPMYRKAEVDEELLENLEILADEKDVAKTANTLIDSILEDMEIYRESYLLGDCSGSMASFQQDVLSKVQVAECKKYVFAGKTREFSENADIENYNIGTTTNIVGALNSILSVAPKDAHIYLLSDLEDNCSGNFDKNVCQDFEGTITIIYYPNNVYGASKNFIKKMQAQMPKATFEIC